MAAWSSSFSLLALLIFSYLSSDPRDLHSFLHDALPISVPMTSCSEVSSRCASLARRAISDRPSGIRGQPRSEEHTSELQSRGHLVCRLLLEKKRKSQPKQKHRRDKLHKERVQLTNGQP